MQFDFLSQGNYTSPIAPPLSFEFSIVVGNYHADQTDYIFPGAYTPSSTFTVGLVPSTVSYSYYSKRFSDKLTDFDFTIRRERLQVTFENPLSNNDGIARYNVYAFQKDFSRGSSESWDYDFTLQSTENLLAKQDTFAFITTCEPYSPTTEFKFGWSWYGDPCIEVVATTANLVSNTTTPVGRFEGSLSPFFIGELSTTLSTPHSIFEGFTPEVHETTLTSQLPTPAAAISVYTSTLFSGELSTTCPQVITNVDCFTTELHSGNFSTIAPDANCNVSVRTSEEYTVELNTTVPNAKAVIDSSISPARETVLTANTENLTADIDVTFDIPTFIQYLNTKFEVVMSDGVQLSTGVCIDAVPTSPLTGTTCSSIDLATSLNVELLIPAKEYEWDINRFLMTLEDAHPLTATICSGFAGIVNLNASFVGRSENSHDSLYTHICAPSESLGRIDALSSTIEVSYTDTDSDFQSYVKRIAGGVEYVPSTIFTMDSFGPSLTVVMTTSNVYSYGVTHHAKLLTSGVCSTVPGIGTVSIHMCSASDEAQSLPYGRYVPSDPVIDPIDPTPPETGVSISVPIKGLYNVINQYSAVLNNGTKIEFHSLKISCDSDSHSWSFTGTLSANQDRSVITPATNGQPIELVVVINSYQWTLLIEAISTTRTFGNTQVAVSGRGITALLSDPYYSTTSLVQSGIQTNQQIAESIVPFDWVIDWSIPTWNVPDATYSHAEVTPVVALSRLVSNCGGMLIPDRTEKKFYAKKRYPVAPWNFNVVSADIIIPDSVIISMTEEPIGQYGYDGVYVHGTTSDGLVALVRKSGTAGSRLVATESNALMVDPTALHTLGERILSGEAPQPVVKQVTTFMDGSTVPLVNIGSLLQVVADGVSTKGIVNGVSISLALDNDALTVTQTLSIGESTDNTFSLLKSLVPTSPLIMGKLVSTDGTKSKVDLVNGGVQNVRGTGTVGLNYYIMDDVIQSIAPNVTAISDIIVS